MGSRDLSSVEIRRLLALALIGAGLPCFALEWAPQARSRDLDLDPAPAPAPAAQSAAERLVLGERLDLNCASAEELALLPGLGEKLAASVVEDRARRGAFADVRALERVRGIGAARARALERWLYADPPQTPFTDSCTAL